jgi:hypothetical protein
MIGRSIAENFSRGKSFERAVTDSAVPAFRYIRKKLSLP